MHILTKNLSNNLTSHKRIYGKDTNLDGPYTPYVIMYIVEKYLDLVKYTLFLLQLQVLL